MRAEIKIRHVVNPMGFIDRRASGNDVMSMVLHSYVKSPEVWQFSFPRVD